MVYKFLIFIVFTLQLVGQSFDTKIKFNKRFVFSFTALENPSDRNSVQSGYRDLFVGEKLSLFTYSYENPHELNQELNTIKKLEYFILKDRNNSIALTGKYDLFIGAISWVDKKAKMDWQKIDSIKQVGQFLAKKANCEFRGRKWTAWYTEEIPISEGPHKFHGLPGLIVELYDENKEFVYRLISFDELKNFEVNFDTNSYERLASVTEYYQILKDGVNPKKSTALHSVRIKIDGEKEEKILSATSLLPKNLIELTDENGKRIVLK